MRWNNQRRELYVLVNRLCLEIREESEGSARYTEIVNIVNSKIKPNAKFSKVAIQAVFESGTDPAIFGFGRRCRAS